MMSLIISRPNNLIMKAIAYLLISAIIVALGCGNAAVEKETPACIKAEIERLKNAPVSSPPSKVYQYTYKGQTVYYIPPKCCDFPSMLFDDSCNVICSPDGGFSGNGDGKCPDFFNARSNEKLIWEDTRK